VDPEETTKFAQEAQKDAITVAARLTGHILNEIVDHTHTHFEYKIPGHANLPTGYSSC
jgi:hypothetical protein